jgi:hypothetical protein
MSRMRARPYLRTNAAACKRLEACVCSMHSRRGDQRARESTKVVQRLFRFVAAACAVRTRSCVCDQFTTALSFATTRMRCGVFVTLKYRRGAANALTPRVEHWEQGALAALAYLLASLAMLECFIQCHCKVRANFTKRIAKYRSLAGTYNPQAICAREYHRE